MCSEGYGGGKKESLWRFESIFFTHRETGETAMFRWHEYSHEENTN